MEPSQNPRLRCAFAASGGNVGECPTRDQESSRPRRDLPVQHSEIAAHCVPDIRFTSSDLIVIND